MSLVQQPYFLVIGLGVSGMSMARFLHAKGKKVAATDIDRTKIEQAAELEALGIEVQIGFHNQDLFNNAACLIPSPGIPLTGKYIATAVSHGVPITGELDIFSDYNTLPVIAVTGTNGKTTTTTLIGEIMTVCGRHPFVGGNIGTPLPELLLSDQTYDIVVAEISSFQLDISSRFRPEIGLLLNISEDHLDRYDGLDAYADSKWHLFSNQISQDTAIINTAINDFQTRRKGLKSKISGFSSNSEISLLSGASIEKDVITINVKGFETIIPTDALENFKGTHNKENLAAAILAAHAAGCDPVCIIKGIEGFKNLPHRMEFVTQINTVSFYNDSKGTNTDAVIRALECFEQPVLLILGGRQKDTDFSLLTGAVRKHVRSIFSIGESQQDVKKALADACPVFDASSMQEAVDKAYEQARENEVVLLSPACASFDMYDNYGHRGDDFKACVMNCKSSVAGE